MTSPMILITFDHHYFFLHFSKNAEFVMTSTEPALWTSAPTVGRFRAAGDELHQVLQAPAAPR